MFPFIWTLIIENTPNEPWDFSGNWEPQYRNSLWPFNKVRRGTAFTILAMVWGFNCFWQTREHMYNCFANFVPYPGYVNNQQVYLSYSARAWCVHSFVTVLRQSQKLDLWLPNIDPAVLWIANLRVKIWKPFLPSKISIWLHEWIKDVNFSGPVGWIIVGFGHCTATKIQLDIANKATTNALVVALFVLLCMATYLTLLINALLYHFPSWIDFDWSAVMTQVILTK